MARRLMRGSVTPELRRIFAGSDRPPVTRVGADRLHAGVVGVTTAVSRGT